MPPFARFLVVVAVAALICVSCGSGDDSTSLTEDDMVGNGADIAETTTVSPDINAPDEPSHADLQAAAIVRLLTVDNSFGPGAEPFATINVGSLIGGDANSPLEPLAIELIASEFDGTTEVIFIADVETLIGKLFDQNAIGMAVASIDQLRVTDSRAELDMRLWCGSLCGVFLTYEAEMIDAGWEILGTTGPIAMS